MSFGMVVVMVVVLCVGGGGDALGDVPVPLFS